MLLNSALWKTDWGLWMVVNFLEYLQTFHKDGGCPLFSP